MKKVKLKSIAEPLGVSITTVHRALNNVKGVNPKTKEMILEKAKALGHDIDLDDDISRYSKKGNRNYNVFVLCPYDIFFETVIDGMKDAKKQLGYQNIHIEFNFEEVYDVVKQSEHLREIIKSNNVDGVAISPAHPLILNPLIDELIDKDKIVVTFNTDAPESKRYCYIGQNAAIAGKMDAEILGMKIGDGSTIAVFKSFSVTSGVREREKGFTDFISDNFQNTDIVGPFEYFDTVQEAKSIAEQVILNNSNIKGIFANNMVGTIGCAQAVISTGNVGKVFVTGFDNNPEIREYVNQGIIVGSVLQDPYYQGYHAIRTLSKLLTGKNKQVRELMHTQCNMLLKSTIDLYEDD